MNTDVTNKLVTLNDAIGAGMQSGKSAEALDAARSNYAICVLSSLRFG